MSSDVIAIHTARIDEPTWPETLHGWVTTVDHKRIGLLYIVFALLFVVGPMAATVMAGLGADLGRLAGEAVVRQATLTSAVLAFLSALLSVTLSPKKPPT